MPANQQLIFIQETQAILHPSYGSPARSCLIMLFSFVTKLRTLVLSWGTMLKPGDAHQLQLIFVKTQMNSWAILNRPISLCFLNTREFPTSLTSSRLLSSSICAYFWIHRLLENASFQQSRLSGPNLDSQTKRIFHADFKSVFTYILSHPCEEVFTEDLHFLGL